MRIGASVSHDFAVISAPRGDRIVLTLLICGMLGSNAGQWNGWT
jgi:hypothetical protein